MGQDCVAGWRLSSVVVVCNAVGERVGWPPGAWEVGRRPGAWAVGWPTLHGGPVRLRHIRVTPCLSQSVLLRNAVQPGVKEEMKVGLIV